MKINDGGPAFPVNNAPFYVEPGMTLRDWFAGQALAGTAHRYDTFAAAALVAYEIADAMLASRRAAGSASGAPASPHPYFTPGSAGVEPRPLEMACAS